MKTVFLRVLEVDDKATGLLGAIREPERVRGQQRFELDPRSFASMPRSPFAYWVSERLRRLFTDLSPFDGEGRTAKVGLQTSDDFRFVRAWWAVPAAHVSARWFPFAKGGTFSPFYVDVHLAVNWERAGREMKAWADPLYDNSGWSRIIKSTELYFRPGLTWPLRATRFAPQALQGGSVFSVRGYCAFTPEKDLAWTLAVFNSSVFDYLFKVTLGRFGFPEFIVGVLQLLPWPDSPSVMVQKVLTRGARRAWSLKRSLDSRTESSHAFTLPALLQVAGADIAARAATWAEHVRTVDGELSGIQAEIDERCFTLYGIDEADRRSITEGFGGGDSESQSSEEASEDDVNEDGANEDSDESESASDAAGLATAVLSWAVGVAFGRFDVRLATGARPLPTEPEPFDPLPACSPGMLTGGDGLPLARPPADYSLAFPESGVLVDDRGHAQDFAAAVRAVFEVIFGADADRWWDDVAALLDPKGHDVRGWLAGSFFEHHLKHHSKSRRKAPILWQLGTPSGRYSVWLYAHRLTRDSFFQLQNEVVGPKLTHEERQLTSLMQNAGGSPSAAERKEIAAQEAVVEELRAMLDEVKRVAPLWNPNLDDGVVLTMAPLWRLVPQHKPWQKELKSKWDELAAGKYDWAHLAEHLWPERVVPKCATDRSLAIAHGVEDVFWVEDENDKWKPCTPPVRAIVELVRERSSPAVKAALQSLLDAPTTSRESRRRGVSVTSRLEAEV